MQNTAPTDEQLSLDSRLLMTHVFPVSVVGTPALRGELEAPDAACQTRRVLNRQMCCALSLFSSRRSQLQIAAMGELVHLLADSLSADTVIDWGAGAGHLSHALAYRHGLRAVAVEATAPLCAAANKRSADFHAMQEPLFASREAGGGGGDGDAGAASASGAGGCAACEAAWLRRRRRRVRSGGGGGGGGDPGPPPMVAVAHKLPWGGDCCAEVGLILSRSGLLAAGGGGSSGAAGEAGGEEQESAETCPVLYAGLHACGDLTAGITRTMLSDGRAAALVSVACCYNLLTEPPPPLEGGCASPSKRRGPPYDVATPAAAPAGNERSAAESVLRAMLPSPDGGCAAEEQPPNGVGGCGGGGAASPEHGFPLSSAVRARFPSGVGRSARMLACQSADRWAAEEGGMSAASLRALTFRAALQVVLEALPPEARPGKVVAKKVLDAVVKGRGLEAAAAAGEGGGAEGGDTELEASLWGDFVRAAVPGGPGRAHVESLGVEQARHIPLPVDVRVRFFGGFVGQKVVTYLRRQPCRAADVAGTVRRSREARRSVPRPAGCARRPARGSRRFAHMLVARNCAGRVKMNLLWCCHSRRSRPALRSHC